MDPEKIEREGVKLLESLSAALESVNDPEATHYVVDLKNVWRKDGKPQNCEGFRDHIEKLAPKFRDGFVVAEKGV